MTGFFRILILENSLNMKNIFYTDLYREEKL